MAKKTLLAGNIASDDDILRYASALDLPTMATPEAQPAKKGGFFESAGSGISTAFKQIPQLAYGLGAIGAAGIESMAGEGGIATALKQGAVDKYLDWSKKIQADSSENYEWDTAYGKAKEGDIGALVDFLGYGIGYGLGQGAQILASAGVGGAVAKTVGREAVEKMASGMVAKEAAELAVKNAALPAAQRVAAAEINKLAVANVATKIGQNAAIGASAFGMEGGEIGGDLVAENRDRELTGSELVRALGATALAGGFEFAGDRLGLSALTGKIGFGKSMTGIGGRAVRAGTGAIAAAPGEFATEYMQTGVENWGKSKEDSLLTWQQSEEAQREAINAGALGAVGGGTYGIIGGALSKAQQDQPVVPASVPATASAQTPATPASQPAPSLTDIAAAPTVEDAIATADAIVSAPVSRDEGMFNLANLEPELKQSGILGSVLGMPAFTAAANPTTTSPLPQTPVAMPGALADIAGVSELSALVEQERADKQARLAAEIERMRQRNQPGEASAVEAPETVQAEAQGAQAPAAAGVAQESRDDLIARYAKADPFSDEEYALSDRLKQSTQQEIDTKLNAGEVPVFDAGRDTFVTVTPSAQQPGKFQVTRYNKGGVFGDTQYDTIEQAISDNRLHSSRILPKEEAEARFAESLKAEAEYQARKEQPADEQSPATVAKKETVASAPQAPAAPAAKTKPQSVGDAIKAEADGAAARDGAGLVREERDAQTRADKASAWKAKHAGNRFETIAARDIVASDHENLAGVVRSGKVTAERAVEMIDDAAASGVLDAKVAGYMKQKVAQAPATPAQSTNAAADTKKAEADFRLYSERILSGLAGRGELAALHKAAGVKSANAFGGLPMDDQAAAYAKFVALGGKPVEGLPEDYNAWVASEERDAEVRWLQSDREVVQANGKPFKTEASARQFQARYDLQGTHEVIQTGDGFKLRQLPPAAQAELKRKAEGRESYADAQSAVAAEMGIGTTAEGEWDATDAQLEEMERRVDARLRGKPAPAAPATNQPAPADKWKGKTLKLYRGEEKGATPGYRQGGALWTTTDKALAENYSGKDGVVKEYSVTLQNPFVFDDDTAERFANFFEFRSEKEKSSLIDFFKELGLSQIDATARQRLIDAGYDSVVVMREAGVGRNDEHPSVILLNPSAQAADKPATNQPAPAVDQAAPAANQAAPDISTDTKPGKAAQRQDGAADTATGQAPQLYRPAIADFFASLPNYATAEELAEALAKTDFSADDKAAIQRVEAGWVDMLENLKTAKKVTIKC